MIITDFMPTKVVRVKGGKFAEKWGKHGAAHPFKKGNVASKAHAKHLADEQRKAAFAHGWKGKD